MAKIVVFLQFAALPAWLAGSTSLAGPASSTDKACDAVASTGVACEAAELDVSALLHTSVAKRGALATSAAPVPIVTLQLMDFLDFTMADTARECGGTVKGSPGSISKDAWACAFDRMDVDGDGQLTAADLVGASRDNASEEVLAMNITKWSCQEAIATVATWYPKAAPFLVKYQPLVLYTAWTGLQPPPGTPEPTESEMVPASFLQAAEEDSEASLEEALAKLSACHRAILHTVLPTMNIFLSAVGLRVPGKVTGALAKGLAKSSKLLRKVETIVKLSGGPSKLLGSKARLPGFIFKVGKELWDHGLLSEALRAARKSMGWWDWTTTIVPLLASLVGFFATGGTANIAIAVTMGGVNVVDLTLALRDVAKTCG